MNWKIIQIGCDATVAFAASELQRYLKKMDQNTRIARIKKDSYDSANTTSLYVGCDPAFASLLPEVKDTSRDDAIYVSVEKAAGIITGTNPRSVLIAVYRYLRALGCAFLRPGKDGDVIPAVAPETIPVTLKEAASRRHRAICIEGAVSYEHVADMIDWIPKMSMNGYFIQFRNPTQFFDRWYKHEQNPYIPEAPMSADEVAGMRLIFDEEIQKRGLLYHAVGHSWTCEPFGVVADGWYVEKDAPPAAIADKLAMIGGKRDWFKGVALNTNLCYSNPEVRKIITDDIVKYCKDNPAINYLHFWLADNYNNHCECENCKLLPADYYVIMLNELDEKLTAAGIDTKIVFLVYDDLLWAPEKEVIKNPDRFTLMFAPITRTYSSSFTVTEEEVNAVELAPYTRNKLTLPSSVAENVARLNTWKKAFNGDSFDFDYHLMWDHYNDPGYIATAKLLSEDMKNLDNIGLNGMNSCQVQRAFFPTALPMVVMAETLWNKKATFKDIARGYFDSAFGIDGIKVWKYLDVVSGLFDPVYLRGGKTVVDYEKAKDFARIPGIADNFVKIAARNISRPGIQEAVKQSWTYLLYHAQAISLYAQALEARAEDRKEDAAVKYEELIDYLNRIEAIIHPVFDITIFRSCTAGKFKR